MTREEQFETTQGEQVLLRPADAGFDVPGNDVKLPQPAEQPSAPTVSEATRAAPAPPLPPAASATDATYDPLQAAYRHFSRELFEDKLPGALITLRNHAKSLGYFSAERFATINNARADEIAMNATYFQITPIHSVLSTLVHEMVHQYQFHFGEPGRGRGHNTQWGQMMSARGLHPTATGRPGGKTTGDKMTHMIVVDGPFEQSCQRLLATDFAMAWFDRYPTEEMLINRPERERYTQAEIDAQAGKNEVPERNAVVEGIAPTQAKATDPVDIDQLAKTGVIAVVAKRKAKNASKTRYTCPQCHTNIWGKPDLKVMCGKDGAKFVGRGSASEPSVQVAQGPGASAGDQDAVDSGAEGVTMTTPPPNSVECVAR